MYQKFQAKPIHHKVFFLVIAATVLLSSVFAGILYAQKTLASLNPAPSNFIPNDPFQIKGETSGIDKHFAITDSEYLNITLDSTENIDLKLVSRPKVITMMFEATTTAQTTQITISNLAKDTTYYKYEDDYHNLTQFTTDSNGSYTFSQDISTRHFVFIQTRKSTKFIADNATGGDCTTIGTWESTTKTCTLTQDLTETIQIDSDGITLDGNGHSILITPEYSSGGVYLYDKTGVTVKNVTINGSHSGVSISGGSNNRVENSTFVGNTGGIGIRYGNNNIISNNTLIGTGITVTFSKDNIIEYNTANDNDYNGISTTLSSGTIIRNNTLNNNRVSGIYIYDSQFNDQIIDNTAQENGYQDIVPFGAESHILKCYDTIRGNIGSGGYPIGYFSTSTTLTSGTFSELILCNADHSTIRNVRVQGSADKKNGIFLIALTNDSKFENISVTNSNGLHILFSDRNEVAGGMMDSNRYGITLTNAHDNRIHENTISNSETSALRFFVKQSSDNTIYNNNFINNISLSLGDGTSNIFDLPKPIGGNYWDSYHTTAQGCNDTDNDGFCDAPYVFGNGVQDNIPWTTQDGWKNVSEKTLQYGSVWEDDLIQDRRGGANKTNFLFKVVYTDTTASTPHIRLVFSGPQGEIKLGMAPDTSTTTPLEYHDGNLANGEAFSRTLTFPKGTYHYHFETEDGTVKLENSEYIFMTGYSNVAFIPGLEASRLFRPIVGGGAQLWLPGASAHATKLYLSSTTGESLDPSIYVSGVVKTAYGVSIYQSFLDKIEEMKTSGDIERFETFPYDWRKYQPNAATQLVSTGPNGEFYSMIDRIKEMADSSPTGKVAIITHSNGGLVAKELADALKQQGKANDIEKIIMVAAPELGTPKAILEMLHGAEPFLLGIPNKETTRELAENMKSAYSLLPSREYFNRLGTPLRPLVEFSTTTQATLSFRNIYGNDISDYDNLRKFLRGENGIRKEPDPSVVNEPNVLKENFLSDAEELHLRQDNWTPPIGVEVVQIIGWGLDTPHGVLYTKARKQKTVCNADLSVCTKTDVIDPQPLKTTIEGDGTVQYVSAEAMGGEKYWVDMTQHNAWWQYNINRDHKNILEIGSLQTLLATLIKNQSTSTFPEYITNVKPIPPTVDKRLRISAHSPVSLHLYDSFGKHTGIIPNPDLQSDFDFVEEQIPNSYYWRIGEGQYTGVGAEATTTIVLKGKETGTFTLEIQEVVGGENAEKTFFQNIPTTASTTATVQVGENVISLLAVDLDGNGTIDAEFSANDNGMISDPLAYLSLMKKTVSSFSLKKQTEKQILTDLSLIEKTLENFIKLDDKTKKIYEKLDSKIRNEKLREKWKEWRDKHLIQRNTLEDKILFNLVENAEKNVIRLRKQKEISIDQADILFTMLEELKSLIK
ncbi:MAG: NosD domain-containing protein [Candidatus Paceibacterota bacterium]